MRFDGVYHMFPSKVLATKNRAASIVGVTLTEVYSSAAAYSSTDQNESTSYCIIHKFRYIG